MAEEEQKCKCPAGIPAWVLTFADLMSLLMCFFVLLLSFAEMDVKKFKQIAGSLKMAFGVQRDIKALEIPKGVNIISKEFSPSPPQPTVINEVRQVTSDDTAQELKLIDKLERLQEAENELKDKMEHMSESESESLTEQLHKLQSEIESIKQELDKLSGQLEAMQAQAIEAKADNLKKALQEEVNAGILDVEANDNNITIRIRDRGSFPAGTARLTEDFVEILEIIAEELVKTTGDIVVAGHTDDIPINSARFRSNWALSSARAVAVAHEFINNNQMEEARFSVQAFADNKPLVENDSRENRAINRRVEIIISQTKFDLGLTLNNPDNDKAEEVPEQKEKQDKTEPGQEQSIPEIEQTTPIPQQEFEPVRQQENENNDEPFPDEEPPSFIQF
ncbi:MAG: OmpA family protein [Proteobacteria bacterium]|nr:OmpA family protein [Pseudomonadota bacterium]